MGVTKAACVKIFLYDKYKPVSRRVAKFVWAGSYAFNNSLTDRD